MLENPAKISKFKMTQDILKNSSISNSIGTFSLSTNYTYGQFLKTSQYSHF